MMKKIAGILLRRKPAHTDLRRGSDIRCPPGFAAVSLSYYIQQVSRNPCESRFTNHCFRLKLQRIEIKYFFYRLFTE